MIESALPVFLYALAFWEALSLTVAGILAFLVYFRKLDPKYGLPAGAVLAIVLAVLKFLGIVPELMARGFLP